MCDGVTGTQSTRASAERKGRFVIFFLFLYTVCT